MIFTKECAYALVTMAEDRDKVRLAFELNPFIGKEFSYDWECNRPAPQLTMTPVMEDCPTILVVIYKKDNNLKDTYECFIPIGLPAVLQFMAKEKLYRKEEIPSDPEPSGS